MSLTCSLRNNLVHSTGILAREPWAWILDLGKTDLSFPKPLVYIFVTSEDRLRIDINSDWNCWVIGMCTSHISKYCPTDFQSGCTHLFSHHQNFMRVSVLPHPCPRAVLPLIWIVPFWGSILSSHLDFTFDFFDEKSSWASFHVFTDHLPTLLHQSLLQAFCPFFSIGYFLLIYLKEPVVWMQVLCKLSVVLVFSGCCNKFHKLGGLRQQESILSLL